MTSRLVTKPASSLPLCQREIVELLCRRAFDWEERGEERNRDLLIHIPYAYTLVYICAHIFSNLNIKYAEYNLDNIPKSGFDDLNNFIGSFPDLDLKLAYGKIRVSSNIFEVNSEMSFNEFVSSSKSIIIYEDNNNGFIISRIYNGI